jgi:DNA-binding transcriptional LysR family regulator
MTRCSCGRRRASVPTARALELGEPVADILARVGRVIASAAPFDAATDFVVAMRKGHVFARTPTLPAFCSAHHLLVSLDGGPHGFVDELLAKRGLQRRIVLTVPTFMMALAHLSSSDLIAALPRRLVERHAARFALAAVELPLKRKSDLIQAVATKAAIMDAGIEWLMQQIGEGGRPRQNSEFST